MIVYFQHSAWEFIHIETAPFLVEDCKIRPIALTAFELEGSLSCHTCCGTRPQFLRYRPKDRTTYFFRQKGGIEDLF
jgi:hypothetical protein